MNKNKGITTLKYFAYQKAIFVHMAFDKLSGESNIVYESDDDDIELFLFNSKKISIQVKGGNPLTRQKIYGVIANWLLCFDEKDDKKYQLVCENKPSFDFDEVNFNDFYTHCFNHKDDNKNSKFARLMNQCKDKNSLLNKYNKLMENIIDTKTIKITDLEDVLVDAYRKYSKPSFLSLDKERTLKISSDIFSFIDKKALFASSGFTLSHSDFDGIVDNAKKMLPYHEKYKFGNGFYECDENEITNLINNSDKRLVNELKKVNDNNVFLVGEIKKEMEYEYFRNLYFEAEEEDIKTLENNCFQNYKLLLFDNNIKTSNDLYFGFSRLSNESLIVLDNPSSRLGCANYLASDNNKNTELIITWEK